MGKTISPVSVVLYVEVVNKSPIISRIYSYKTRALLRYDEGGSHYISPSKNTRFKVEYKVSGNIVEKWRTLHSIGFIDDKVYFVTNNDWSETKRIDFTQNSFEMLARNTQLKPGESLMGWIFFELEQDLRGQVPKIKEIELTLANSAGESQIFKSFQEPKGEDGMSSSISSGDWHLMEGYYDLTKEQYAMVPMIDLHQILKDGKAQVVKPISPAR